MKKNSTILLVRNAAKDDFGGAETYPINLSVILKNKGYSPIIVSRSKKVLKYAKDNSLTTIKGWWWSRQNWSGKKVILFPAYVAWQLLLTLWYIGLLMKTRAIAIHLQSKDDFIAGTLAGRLLKRKVVWTDHMDLRYVFENISQPLRNPVGKFVYKAGHLADHIILISDNEYRLVTNHFPNKSALESRIVKIYNGVVDKYKDYPPYYQGKNFSFCLASRVVKNKGIKEAIQAYELLVKDPAIGKLNTSLDIYGDGADIEEFKQLAKDTPSIRFHGHQSDAIEKILRADVYMLPSYQEGFSIALLEASMLSKAIIATDVDSNAEIIHDNETGLLVPVKDIVALKDAMLHLALDTSLKNYLQINARKNYIEHYDLAEITEKKIIPLYS